MGNCEAAFQNVGEQIVQNFTFKEYLGRYTLNNRITGVLKLLLGLVLIVVFIRQIQWNTFIETIASVNVSFLVLGITLTFFNVFISASRWYLLLKALNPKVEFFELIRILFIGLFFNTFLPGGFAGDIVRGIQSKGDSLSFEDAFSSVLTDRILGFIGLVFLSIVGIIYKWELIKHSGLSLYIILTCAFVIGLTCMLYNRRIMRRFRFILSALGKLGQKIESLYRSLYQYRHKLNTIYASFGITVINHLVMFISVYYLALSLGSEVSFSYFVLFLPLIGTLSMLPITIGGLGLRELGFVVLFPLVGMTKVQALGTSLFFFMAMVFVALIGALVYLVEAITALMTNQTA